MATLTIPPFLADGGEMTVMRHVASHAFGALSVTYPEGVEPPEGTDLGQGYSYRLRNDPPPFGRGFIRADLDIDAENGTSTVEEILDDVTGRTAGEALFQRDIPRAGLGRLQLGVDFNVGDLAPVRLWGRILPNQLITAADDMSTPGDPLGCRVHVGGQLIREPSSLAKGNRDIARQIAQERKERLAQVKAVDKKADTAQSTADTAQGTAETAKDTAEDAKTTADDALAAATDTDGFLEEKRMAVESAVADYAEKVILARQAADDMDVAVRLYSESVSEVEDLAVRVETAAGNVVVAADDVAELIEAPEGEFRLGVSAAFTVLAIFTEEQSDFNLGVTAALQALEMVAEESSEFNQGVVAALDALEMVANDQSDFNLAIQQTLTARNDAQDARDAAQDIAIQDSNDRITFQEEALAQLAGMQERLARASTRMLEAHRSEVIATDECWKLTITIDGTVARFEPVVSAPAWSGKCVAEIRVWKPSSGTSVTDESRIVRMRWNGSPGSETQIYMVEDGYLIESVMLLYNYSEGEFKTAGDSGGPVTIDELTSHTFGTFIAPVTGSYTVSASTLWANVRGGSIHECAITRIGVPVIVDSQKFHQNRRDVRIAPVPRTLSLAAGEEITFMAWTNAPFTIYRSIQWEWSVTWLEPVEA